MNVRHSSRRGRWRRLAFRSPEGPAGQPPGQPRARPAVPAPLPSSGAPLTAYWNFSLYSLSLARALLSSSATEGSAVGATPARPYALPCGPPLTPGLTAGPRGLYAGKTGHSPSPRNVKVSTGGTRLLARPSSSCLRHERSWGSPQEHRLETQSFLPLGTPANLAPELCSPNPGARGVTLPWKALRKHPGPTCRPPCRSLRLSHVTGSSF